MQLGPAEICGIRKPKVTFRSKLPAVEGSTAGRSPLPAYAETLKNESLFYGQADLLNEINLLFSALAASRQEYDFMPPSLVSHADQYASQPERLRKEKETAHKLLDAGWLKGDIEKMAMHFAIAQLAPEHLRETRERRLIEIDRAVGCSYGTGHLH
jgi:hypothetical protein